MVPPPGSSYARSHHTMSQYPGQYPAHELLNPAAAPLHPFTTTGPSLHNSLMGYPDQHGYVPASMHDGHHAPTHVPSTSALPFHVLDWRLRIIQLNPTMNHHFLSGSAKHRL